MCDVSENVGGLSATLSRQAPTLQVFLIKDKGAGVGVGDDVLGESGSNGIGEDVACHLLDVLVLTEDVIVEPSLPQLPSAAKLPIGVGRSALDGLDGTDDILVVSRCKKNVDVIGHDAVGIQVRGRTADLLFEDLDNGDREFTGHQEVSSFIGSPRNVVGTRFTIVVAGESKRAAFAECLAWMHVVFAHGSSVAAHLV